MTDTAKTKTPVLAKITSDKIYCWMTMIFFIFLPVSELITEILKATKNKAFRFMYPSFFQSYIVAIFGIAGTVLVILTLIARAVSGKFKLYVPDVFYFTLIFFMLVSMFCSVNFGVFSGGSAFYCEWPAHFLCYYWLFFAGSMIADSKLRKKLLAAYVIVAVMQGIVAFLQTYRIEICYCLFMSNRVSNTTPYGLLQNTNFYGTLSCLLTAVTSGLFVFSSKLFKSKILKWGIFALALLVFYTMIASQARLAWIGIAAMLFTYIVSLIVMRKSNMDKASLKQITVDFFIMLAGYVVIIVIAVLFTTYITSRVNRITEDTVGKVGDEGFGNGRGRIWKAALSSVRKHWLTGIGLDNLAQAFREQPGWQPGDYVQDKGHNEYIHTLATQGVFALINYLALLIYAAVSAVKAIFNEKDDVKRCLLWLFLGAFAAYAGQALLSSSVMNVAVYFWPVIGLLTSRTKPISLRKR